MPPPPLSASDYANYVLEDEEGNEYISTKKDDGRYTWRRSKNNKSKNEMTRSRRRKRSLSAVSPAPYLIIPSSFLSGGSIFSNRPLNALVAQNGAPHIGERQRMSPIPPTPLRPFPISKQPITTIPSPSPIPQATPPQREMTVVSSASLPPPIPQTPRITPRILFTPTTPIVNQRTQTPSPGLGLINLNIPTSGQVISPQSHMDLTVHPNQQMLPSPVTPSQQHQQINILRKNNNSFGSPARMPTPMSSGRTQSSLRNVYPPPNSQGYYNDTRPFATNITLSQAQLASIDRQQSALTSNQQRWRYFHAEDQVLQPVQGKDGGIDYAWLQGIKDLYNLYKYTVRQEGHIPIGAPSNARDIAAQNLNVLSSILQKYAPIWYGKQSRNLRSIQMI